MVRWGSLRSESVCILENRPSRITLRWLLNSKTDRIYYITWIVVVDRKYSSWITSCSLPAMCNTAN